MSEKSLVTGSDDELYFLFWVADPANPVADQNGLLRKGETIWFQADQFGSGPAWQVAKLMNGTICFVQPHQFSSIVP